jgi:hypothetical protein
MSGETQRLGVFHTTCWVLGLIAFVELAAVGLAMGLQREVSSSLTEPRIVERVVTEYRTLPAEKETVVVEKPVYIEKEIPSLPDGPPTFRPENVDVPLTTPPIADPVVERLVEEARTLRVAGDSMRAMLKLEEAIKKAPENANVLYQFAEVYETMGLYDQAADHYQKVFELGTMGAGSLYELAAVKLRDGIEQPEDMAGKFALGRVRVFEDKSWPEGQRVVLSIPVSAAPGMSQSAKELEQALELQVHIYDQLKGEAVRRDSYSSNFKESWVTPPIDWQDGGEELLRVIYEIPEEGKGTTHLLGQRRYLGQVVELYYEGELLDRLASPRRLAREVIAPGQDVRGEEVFYYPDNYVPDDFNFENPLLPPLPE